MILIQPFDVIFFLIKKFTPFASFPTKLSYLCKRALLYYLIYIFYE